MYMPMDKGTGPFNQFATSQRRPRPRALSEIGLGVRGPSLFSLLVLSEACGRRGGARGFYGPSLASLFSPGGPRDSAKFSARSANIVALVSAGLCVVKQHTTARI